AFFFVWMILSFFLTADWEGVTLQRRTVTGLFLSLAAMVAYALWRGRGGPAALPGLLLASLPIWRRNLGLMGRNFLR
ncbi:hypothetical protein R0J93_29300, partial [Pseudoalteromonas sp. SIMBA_148]